MEQRTDGTTAANGPAKPLPASRCTHGARIDRFFNGITERSRAPMPVAKHVTKAFERWYHDSPIGLDQQVMFLLLIKSE